jgi:hypothetical protein
MTFSAVRVRCTAAESVFSRLKNKDAGVAIYRYRLLILWKETYFYISLLISAHDLANTCCS